MKSPEKGSRSGLQKTNKKNPKQQESTDVRFAGCIYMYTDVYNRIIAN